MTAFNLGQKVRNKTLGLAGRVTSIDDDENGEEVRISILSNWWFFWRFVGWVDVGYEIPRGWEPVPAWQYRASYRRTTAYYYLIPTLSWLLTKNSRNAWIILISAGWIDWTFSAKIWRDK